MKHMLLVKICLSALGERTTTIANFEASVIKKKVHRILDTVVIKLFFMHIFYALYKPRFCLECQ